MTRVTIERLGHLGDGIAPGPVFVPGTLPGEVVEGDISGDTMTAPRIVTPVPERVRAPCRHARACGGCQLQHASDPFVADWKRQVVRTALAAQGLEAEIGPVETSPPGTRRRARFSARRTKTGATAGFHSRGSAVIVEVPDCRVVHPDLLAGLPIVREIARLGTSRKAEIAVQVTVSEAGLDLAVTGGRPINGDLRLALAELADRHDLARLAWNDDEVLVRRAPIHRFGPAAVTPPPGAFLQATAAGETALVDAVRRIVGPARRVLDLFAGCGTFALPLAARAEVHAVEGDGAMLAALDRAWRQGSGLRRVTCETRDLFRNPLLSDELARFDAAVIDPPRAGAEAQMRALAQARLPVVASISCNPVTFARDAAILVAAGYRLGPVTVIDQFRWSTHIEIAAALTLAQA